MIKITITTFLFLLSALTVAAPHVHPVQTNTNEQEIIDIISGIKYGWENGDGAPFRKTFLDFKGALILNQAVKTKVWIPWLPIMLNQKKAPWNI